MTVPFTSRIPAPLLRRVRATVAGMQRVVGSEYTLTRFTTEALTAHIRHLEEEHHDGRPWPTVSRLTPGPRVIRDESTGEGA